MSVLEIKTIDPQDQTYLKSPVQKPLDVRSRPPGARTLNFREDHPPPVPILPHPPAPSNCVWPSVLQIQVISFATEQNWDSLEIYDGGGRHGTQTGQLLG